MMDELNFNNLVKSQAIRRVAVDDVYGEEDTYYNSGISEGIKSIIEWTTIEALRVRFKLFIWISPVCLNGEIIGYTYEGEFALQQNNTFSDMDYSKYPTYASCKTATVNYSFEHAYENKYQF